MNDNKTKKIVSLSITLFIIMLLVSGGSFAYWTWVTADSERTGLAFNVSAPDMSASLDGHSVTVTNLIPISSCTDETYAIKKQLTLTYENNSTNAGEILGTLSIEEDSFISPHGTPDSDDLSHLHYAVTLSPDNCTAEPLEGMSGTFTETSGQLFSSQKLVGPIPAGTDETSMTFYLWVWLDSDYTHQNVGSGVSNDPMQDISFTLVWNGEIKNDLVVEPSPNAPVLDDGMIPVTIANNGTVTTVAETDSSWYNYENKEWANVVLVSSDSRTTYKNSTGVTVNQDDILAYYVWIPRYKYKIWTTTISSRGNEQEIDIEFEKVTDSILNGTTIDSWKTHPAFIWDDNPISGIWVGKFENGHSTLSTSTSNNNLNCTNENCTNADGLIIKPNAISLRYNSVSNQFYASRSMTRSGNPFGLSASTTDSHMMKNSEWGAVAYLSHSQYGINEEIRLNNNSNHTTGCGASEENATESATCEITYGGASSYPQSTTGNITGVFDMSGGTWEYVMGNYNNTIRSAGFTTLPSSKYYDVYSIASNSSCTIETCGGHALFETAGWYTDNKNIVNSADPWFMRGGYYSFGSYAGVWASNGDYGYADSDNGFRSSAIVGA